MGRRTDIDRTNFVYFDKTSNTSTCLLCQRALSGNLLSNIKRHYVKLHNWDFDSGKKPQILSGFEIPGPAPKKLRHNFPIVTVNRTKEEFLKCCVGFVTTTTGATLDIFNDGLYFKPLISLYENAYQLDLNASLMLEHIQICAQRMREYLTRTLDRKMICLKVDVVRAMDRSFLSVGVQYLKDMELIFHTLGVTELGLDQKFNRLKEEVVRCLHNCGSDITHLYACTVGGDERLLSALNLLKQDMHEEIADNKPLISQNDEDEQEVVQTRLQTVFNIVRSAAATIHLTVQDAFQRMLNKLEDCRRAIRALSESSTCYSGDLRLPAIDSNCDTDWRCTYDMLVALDNVRELIVEEITVDAAQVDWTFVEQVLEAYKPMEECARTLDQQPAYIIGDFYRDWLMCEAKLECLADNTYAQILLAAMQTRKNELLDNDAFLAALYLDPRFNYVESPLLSAYQKRNAVLHILETNTLVDLLCGDTDNQVPAKTARVNYQPVAVAPDDPFDLLEGKINAIAANNTGAGGSSDSCSNLPQKLDDFAYGQRKPFSTNVMDQWKSKEDNLVHIAQVVLSPTVAAGPQELTAETLTSWLTSEQHLSGSSETFDDFLFVKLNHNLLQFISMKDND